MTLKKQRGQVLLIVILVVIVASTIGLSIASRSIISLRSSTEEAESQKALAAAEAGIERALQGGDILPTGTAILANNNLGNKSAYSVDVTGGQSYSFLINGGNVIPKDEGADVWFVNHDVNGNPDYSTVVTYNNFLHLYWGTSSETCGNSSNMPAAIEAIVVTRNPATAEIKSYRYAYDSCSGSRSNNFTTANSGEGLTIPGVTGVTFTNKTPEGDLAKGLTNVVLMRVIPLYKDTIVGVYACNAAGTGCTTLPLQGYIISSTGTSNQANRKITVFRGYPQTYLPYLSYGLFVAN